MSSPVVNSFNGNTYHGVPKAAPTEMDGINNGFPSYHFRSKIQVDATTLVSLENMNQADILTTITAWDLGHLDIYQNSYIIISPVWTHLLRNECSHCGLYRNNYSRIATLVNFQSADKSLLALQIKA